MTLSRRDFVATSVFGAAGLYATTELSVGRLDAQSATAAEDGFTCLFVKVLGVGEDSVEVEDDGAEDRRVFVDYDRCHY